MILLDIICNWKFCSKRVTGETVGMGKKWCGYPRCRYEEQARSKTKRKCRWVLICRKPVDSKHHGSVSEMSSLLLMVQELVQKRLLRITKAHPN